MVIKSVISISAIRLYVHVSTSNTEIESVWTLVSVMMICFNIPIVLHDWKFRLQFLRRVVILGHNPNLMLAQQVGGSWIAENVNSRRS